MRRKTYEEKYKGSLWFLRAFDFWPENLARYGVNKVSQQYVDYCSTTGRGKIYTKLQDAVNDAYSVRVMLGIPEPDAVYDLLNIDEELLK